MKAFSLMISMCLFFVSASTLTAEMIPAWRKLPTLLGNSKILGVAFDEHNKKVCFLAMNDGLVKVDIEGPLTSGLGKRLLTGAVYALRESQDLPQLWAATDSGVKTSLDHGETWKEIFSAETALDVLSSGKDLWIGTRKGLFIKKDAQSAMRMPGEVGHRSIRLLRRSSHGILAVSHDRIYMIDPNKVDTKVIFDGTQENEDIETSEETIPEPFIRAVEEVEGTIYVVTEKGLWKGAGKKDQWSRIADEGLSLYQVRSLAFAKGSKDEPVLCVAGDRGVQCQLDGQWTALERGLGAAAIEFLKIGANGQMLAAGRELFYLPNSDEQALLALTGILPDDACTFKNYAALQKEFLNEPDIGTVQTMAIRYSDTDKRKIDAWQRQSRLKAFIPSVSAGVERDNSGIYRWDTGPNPDVLQKGPHAHDWSVDVSWDLADIIWSSSQTSIDSRSKMMVELREEILDQVTRLYFERRRMQIELASCQYPTEGERMAAEMRVHELSAHLDAYTGGAFSKKINHHSNT